MCANSLVFFTLENYLSKQKKNAKRHYAMHKNLIIYLWGNSHTPTDRLVVSRPLLLYHCYGIHSHYGFAKKKLIPASLTEIIQSIYITFLSGVPRFSDGMFRLECGGLRHVVRAMMTANVRSQKLKIEKLSINPLYFHR